MAFGQSRGLGQARDVALKDLSVNQTVFVKNELTVRGMARVDGFRRPGDSGATAVRDAARQDGSRRQRGAEGAAERRGDCRSNCRPFRRRPANTSSRCACRDQPGELVTTNNELSTFVTVLKGGVNVLYLEGALRVDQKFLRRSLDASPDIKVDYVRLDPRDPAQRPVDLAERFRRGKYDVYILGDVDASVFTPEELQAAGRRRQAGRGPDDARRLSLVRARRLRRHAAGRSVAGRDGPARAAAAGRSDSPRRATARAAADAAGQAAGRAALPDGAWPTGPTRAGCWEKLPPLEGANRLGAAKPSAQVLAETPDGKPLLGRRRKPAAA